LIDDPFSTQPASPGGADHAQMSLRHPDEETLGVFLDGGLSPGEARLVAAHLAGCGDCRREIAALRATVALLGGLPQYEPRRSFRLLSQQAVRGRATGDSGRLARLLPSFPSLRIATVAVAMLLLLVGTGDVLTHRDESSETSSVQPAARAIATLPVAKAGEQQPVLDLEQAPSSASGAPGAFSAPAAAPADSAAGAAVTTNTPPSLATTAAPQVAAPAQSTQSEGNDGPSFWRLGEVALALILAWLLVSLTGLQQMRWRQR